MDYVKLFPSLYTGLRRESDDIATIPSFAIVEEKSQFLINIIANITNKTDNEIISFIQKYHTTFLNYNLFTESDLSRSSMQRLFTNVKFLNLFFNMIGKLNLDQFEIGFLNRIVYDYWSLPEKDNDVYNILLQISSYINNNMIIKLSSKMGVNEAKILAMIAASTNKDDIKVHRINRFLVNCDNPVLDEQSMIDIMFFLYEKFLYPIIYTLLETKSCCISEDNLPQYYKLLNAIITILLSMPSDKITTVLTEYGYLISSGKVTPIIELKKINDARLKSIIDTIETNPLIKEIP